MGGEVKATFGKCPKVSGFFLGMPSLTYWPMFSVSGVLLHHLSVSRVQGMLSLLHSHTVNLAPWWDVHHNHKAWRAIFVGHFDSGGTRAPFLGARELFLGDRECFLGERDLFHGIVENFFCARENFLGMRKRFLGA